MPLVTRWLLAQLLALVLLVGAKPASAGPFELKDSTWEGCSELLALARSELGENRVVLTATLDWEAVGAGDAVLVIHPVGAVDHEEAAAFMKAGGRLAVIDDYGRGDELLSHFKIRRRTLPGLPSRYLRGNPEIAVALPVSDGLAAGVHPTVAGVRHVVLNHASGLDHPDLTPVLEVRDGSGGAAVTVAVAGQVAKGRLFAMGDPSAFINLMLRYPGNRELAKGLVRYLADGESGDPRGGKLYIVANDFTERGSFGGVTPARKAFDRRLRELLDGFDDLRRTGFPWWLHLAVAAACALGVMAWAAQALARTYAARLPRYARETPLAAQGGAAGRVAVLASPASPPALAMLELRAALCESLSQLLGAPEHTPPAELLDELRRRRSLGAKLAARAVEVVALMRVAETVVTGGRGARIRQQDVAEAAEVVDRLVELASSGPGGASASRAPDG